MVIKIIFLLLILAVFYTYLGYPLLLFIISLFSRKSPPPQYSSENELPRVALLIAAYNEEDIIESKIKNSLSLLYPSGKLRTVVVSDGSTDRTEEITRRYRDNGVELIRVRGRKGKTAARNEAVEQIDSQILVFSDANAMYKSDALMKLIRHFRDPQTGAVCGNLLLLDRNGKENLYWKYEKAIKSMEDRVHSIVGANGSIYAIRRQLYHALPPEVDDDFVEPLYAYMAGSKVNYEREAISVEEDISGSDMHTEFQAKKRVVIRGIQSLENVKQLLNPLNHPVISWELISHKIFKWSVAFLLIAIFILNFFLPRTPLFIFTFIVQVVFYIMAVTGMLSQVKAFYVPAFFVSTNAAVMFAVIDYLTGKRSRTWERKRG